MEVNNETNKLDSAQIAARCHEIQTGLGTTEVPEFEQLAFIGMAIRLALHIRGLPGIPFEIVKLVGYHYLGIPSTAIRTVLKLLDEVEFVRLGTEGRTIKTILPNVPYYEELYAIVGQYSDEIGLSEAEHLSIDLLHRLARSPQKLDALRDALGVDHTLFKRVIDIGKEGAYIRQHRARGRDILLAPAHFAENPDIFVDAIASGGAAQVEKLMEALKNMQGYPLALIEQTNKIGDVELSYEETQFLVRLAQDGIVKPPSLETPHAGENFFLFTPTPSGSALAPTKRDIYEKAMAIVAAIRQGQFLPRRFAIRSPGAVLYKLRSDLKLSKATTEAAQQYKNLVHLRIAKLVDVGHGYKRLEIIDTEENIEALDIAYELVSAGMASGIEVDADARKALQEDQTYIESVISRGKLQKARQIPITDKQAHQMSLLIDNLSSNSSI